MAAILTTLIQSLSYVKGYTLGCLDLGLSADTTNHLALTCKRIWLQRGEYKQELIGFSELLSQITITAP